MSSRSHVAASSIAVALSALWLGCGGTQSTPQQPAASPVVDDMRTRECTNLVGVINRGVQNIDHIGDGGPEMSGSELLAMASMLETAAAEASHIPLTLPALQQRALDYRDMASRSAAAARTLAAAMEADDAARIETASLALQSAVEPEERVIQAINALCETPRE